MLLLSLIGAFGVGEIFLEPKLQCLCKINILNLDLVLELAEG